MMTRPFIILLAGSLLSAATANADRRSKRDRDRDRDEETEESASRVAKRSIGGEDRRRAAKSIEEDEESDIVEDEDRPKKKKKRSKERVANAPGETPDSDGPEAIGVVPIKLTDLIEVAVRHAPNLARAKLARIAAKGDAGFARIDQAWVLTAKAQYSQYGVGGDVDVNLLDVVEERKVDGTLGLGRRLPTGGKIGVEVGINRTEKEIAISKELLENIDPTKPDQQDIAEFSTSHQATASLTLTQPLLRGIGSDVALAKERKADLTFSEATISAQIEAEKMVLEVVKAYWELAYASHEVDTRMDSLDLAERQEKLTREEIRAGASPTSALNAVTYEIASREEAKLRAQTEFEAKSLDLRRKAGLELSDRSLVIRPGEPFSVGKQEFDAGEMLERSRQTNRRLVLLALKKRSANVDVDVAKNQMLPQLDLNLSAGIMGTGVSSDDAFSNASGANGYQVMASLTFQWELSGAAKDAHKAALARRATVEVERLDVQRQIDTEVVQAVQLVKTSRVRVGLAEKAAAVAEENVKAERAQFQAQRSTNFDVMRRQSELAEANLRRGRAIAEYHMAVAQLQYLSGTLLEDYGVNVRPVAEQK
ncbi:MAG: TolC family protein [Myxococcota bacterium]|nr:TolC family protein [Myxococcota bacterium]